MQIEFFYSDGNYISPMGIANIPDDTKVKDVTAAIKDLGFNDQARATNLTAKRGSVSGRQHSDAIVVTIQSPDKANAVPVATEIIQELASRA